MRGAQVNVRANVYIRRVSKDTGEVFEEQGNNIVTKNLLWGLVNLIKGEYNTTAYSSVDQIQATIEPRVPYNVALGNDNTPASVNDTGLGNQLYITGSDLPAIFPINERTTPTVQDADYLTLEFRSFISSEATLYDPTDPQSEDVKIKEIALLSRSGYCCARYVLTTPISKATNDFIDVIWQLTFRAVHDADADEENEDV